MKDTPPQKKTTKLKKMVKKYAKKIKKIGVLKQINFDAAGIDVGADEIYVAIPEERSDQFVRKFGTFTQNLHQIVKWLQENGVTTAALESTGVYWMPLYDLLEKAGIDIYLVDARKTKNVAGRKTDVADCQWIQQLHTYGLLRKAFVPDGQIRNLRTLERQRDMLSRSRSSHIQHMQKAMEEMNVKLTNVLTDITGKSGMAIIRAIVAGERDPNQLAQHRDYRCRKSEKEIALSLEGNFDEG
ncbi:MAG: IS110 family transposase, partial [Deltaproteobacteria bacterium]|nr:IS110 family transposase [Deltaproteobacteria bacterium]